MSARTPSDAPSSGLRGRVSRATQTKTVRDTGWTMMTEMAGMLSQFLTLVLIGRAFDTSTYGVFASTVAFMHIISPFTTVGMGYVLVQRVAGERGDPNDESGRAWTTVVLGGLAGTAFVVATSAIIVPGVPLQVVLALALGELIFTQITYTGKFCAQAMERAANGAQVVATVWGVRLIAAFIYVGFVPRPTLIGWAYFHLGASALGAVLTIIALKRMLHLSPRVALARAKDVRTGLAYSLTIGASYLKNDIDKTLLLTFRKDAAAGIYNLAYRVIAPLYVPVRALADSTFGRFFREGQHSAEETYKLARRTTLIGAGITFAGGVAVMLCAPLLPHILGQKWHDAVLVTRWLAFVPTLVSMQMYAFNALIGLGRRRACLGINMGSALLNVVMNLALIPRYDWRGATAATIVAEGASVIALWTVLHRETTLHAQTREHLRSV